MTGFLWRKMWKNKWLMLCLLLGNIILIGMVTGVPLFTTATMQRVLQEDLRNVREQQNTFPAMLQLRYTFNNAQPDLRYSNYINTRDNWWPQTVEAMIVPPDFGMRTYVMNIWAMSPAEPREIPNRNRTLSLVGTEGFERHINLLHGRMPSDELHPGNIIDVLATDSAMHIHNLLLDELMYVRGVGAARDRSYFVRVVGIYEFAEGSDAYWAAVDLNTNNTLLVSDSLVYSAFIENYIPAYSIHVTWTQVLDFTAMRATQVPLYQEALRERREFFGAGGIWRLSDNFYGLIEQNVARTDRLALTVLVLQLPIYVMLALFMYMVSRQILLLDKNDISVLKSRGASRRQIMGIYAAQGFFVGAASFPFGLGLGVALCHLIGASNGFLDMVQRAALDVEITGTAVLYGLLAAGLSYIYMLIPVVKFAGITIVEHKQSRARKTKKPLWQRYFIDILAFGVSVYGLYTFNSRQELMMEELLETSAFDPLIFVSSSLFIIGAGLICLRLYPHFIKLLFLLGRRTFSPPVYASMLKTIRSAGEEQFIMLFLVFTVAIGIFSAQSARTINLNNAHRIQYLGGADLMLREEWTDNIPPPAFLGEPPPFLVYTEPDFHRFTGFEEVDSLTPVMLRGANVVRGTARVDDIRLMGVDTRSFGETIWFRDDLLMVHINHFLNLLSGRPNGVLLSDNFRTELEFSVGDVVTVVEEQRFGIPSTGRFTVVGFVEHWPGFNPVEREMLVTGEIRQTSQFLAVANLGHLQTTWGVRPYQIWMRTNTDSHRFIHDFIQQNNIRVVQFYDTNNSLVEIMNDPIVQGTNGVLTISFIMTLLLCFTGFLIYWILSIKGRLLQFGIFRAIGMGMRDILSLLISEQALTTLSSLIIGGIIGELASRLFVPLLQLSYTAADQVIPLLIVMEPRDYINLYALLGFMIVLCIAILTSYASRANVSQVLKLGED